VQWRPEPAIPVSHIRCHEGGVRFIAALSGGIPRHAFLREGIPEDHILMHLQDLLGLVQML
jgi:hypothetical protein